MMKQAFVLVIIGAALASAFIIDNEKECRPEGEPCNNDAPCCGTMKCFTYNDNGDGNCLYINELENLLDEMEQEMEMETETKCMTEGIGECHSNADCCDFLYCDKEFPNKYGVCMISSSLSDFDDLIGEAVEAEPSTKCFTEGIGDCHQDADCCDNLYCDKEFPGHYGVCMIPNNDNNFDLFSEAVEAEPSAKCFTEGIGDCHQDSDCCDNLYCDKEFPGHYGVCMIPNNNNNFDLFSEAVEAEPSTTCFTEGEGSCQYDSQCCSDLYCDTEFSGTNEYGVCLRH